MAKHEKTPATSSAPARGDLPRGGAAHEDEPSLSESLTLDGSPVGDLLSELQSLLAAKRRDTLARVRDIESALFAYRRALEERLVKDFARDHALRSPRTTGVIVEIAAARLRDAVLALPELASPEPATARTPSQPAAQSETLASGIESSEALPESEPAAGPLPWLSRLSTDRRLVIVGALSGRQKLGALPPNLEARTEWVDTESDGVHAIGNLPQRIRQGRVAAVIILDRAVQHKHTEPLVAAARATGVPVGFAGRGGILSLRRALEQIEKQIDKTS